MAQSQVPCRPPLFGAAFIALAVAGSLFGQEQAGKRPERGPTSRSCSRNCSRPGMSCGDASRGTCRSSEGREAAAQTREPVFVWVASGEPLRLRLKQFVAFRATALQTIPRSWTCFKAKFVLRRICPSRNGAGRRKTPRGDFRPASYRHGAGPCKGCLINTAATSSATCTISVQKRARRCRKVPHGVSSPSMPRRSTQGEGPAVSPAGDGLVVYTIAKVLAGHDR